MFISHHYERRRLRLMAQFATGKRLLDVGYAEMPNPYLSSCFYRVGYDRSKPSNGMVKYEEEIEGDVRHIKNILGDRRFDTIICGELIEHIENPYMLLRDLRKLLNDNGKLILSTPNPMAFPVIIFELIRNKSFFYTKDHFYYFLPRWVERMIDFSGYRVKKLQPVGIWLPWVVIPFSPLTLSYQIIYVAEKK